MTQPAVKLPALPPEEIKKILSTVRQALDQGDDGRAQAELARLLSSNPEEPRAQLFMRQLTEEPAVFFADRLKNGEHTYTVQANESLSTIAQSRLGNQDLFVALARHNKINPPNRIQLGQAIRIPGKPAAVIAPPPPPPAAPPPPPPVPPPPQQKPADQAMAKGKALEKDNPEGAYYAYVEALGYGHPDAQAKVDETRKRVVQNHTKLAVKALSQDNDLRACIAEWDNVLKFDRDNESAKASRARCVKLCNDNPDKCKK